VNTTIVPLAGLGLDQLVDKNEISKGSISSQFIVINMINYIERKVNKSKSDFLSVSKGQF